MASFLSAISLLVLVLATGCFTLPMDTKYPTTTPIPPLQLEITTGSLAIDSKDRINMRLVSEAESTSVPSFDHPHKLSNDNSNLEWTTVAFEDFTRSPRGDDAEDDQSENELEQRGVDLLSATLLPETYTTGAPFTSSHFQQDRKIFDSTTVSSTTESVTLKPRPVNNEDEWKFEERGLKDEEEQEEDQKDERGLKDEEEEEDQKDERGLKDEEESELDERGLKDEEDEEDQKDERAFEDKEESPKDERDIEKDDEESTLEERADNDELEITTNPLSSFGQTSSTVAPHLYTSDPSSSAVVSFGKSTGLLTDDKPVSNKPTKLQPQRKLNTKARLPTKENVDDESKAPIAQLDQDPLVQVPNVKSHAMVLEDDSKLPQELSTSTLANERITVPHAPLAQGKQPLQFEKTESNN